MLIQQQKKMTNWITFEALIKNQNKCNSYFEYYAVFYSTFDYSISVVGY